MKRLPKLNLLVISIIGSLFFAACSNGNLQVTDDKTGTTPQSLTDITTEPDDTSGTAPITDGQTTPPATTPPAAPDVTTPQPSVTTPVMSETDSNQITLTAQQLLGLPFTANAASPDAGFDSSGFIYYVLKENGYVSVPRGITEQAEMGMPVKAPGDLKSGDLVFFSENNTGAQFGGIYIGDGIMISCSMPGEGVKEVNITSDYYLTHFFIGVRVL